MSDINKQKARKYKYLKLKQQLYGGRGDQCVYRLPIDFVY
jgi:hypothetical protein